MEEERLNIQEAADLFKLANNLNPNSTFLVYENSTEWRRSTSYERC